jgi:hypothetical protein
MPFKEAVSIETEVISCILDLPKHTLSLPTARTPRSSTVRIINVAVNAYQHPLYCCCLLTGAYVTLFKKYLLLLQPSVMNHP